MLASSDTVNFLESPVEAHRCYPVDLSCVHVGHNTNFEAFPASADGGSDRRVQWGFKESASIDEVDKSLESGKKLDDE